MAAKLTINCTGRIILPDSRRSPALASSRAAWTRSGGHWWITEDKALRSEYLAWPAAHIVGFELQHLETTSFERIIKQH